MRLPATLLTAFILCPYCKTATESAALVAKIKLLAGNGGYWIPNNTVILTAERCERCRGTGFQGRLNLYEVLPCNLKSLARLLQSGTQGEMLRVAVENGMRTLLADGVRHAVEGETSLEEVLRLTDTGI